jgi:hypothetical protein
MLRHNHEDRRPVGIRDVLTYMCQRNNGKLLLIAVCVFVLKQVLDYWGPARMKGMASSVEAVRLLGITRLRKNRAVVRPDLYGKRRNPA